MKSNIRKLRHERQMTQEALAKAIGKTQQAVSQMEQDRDHISIESLLAMADFFGVTTDYILDRGQAPETAISYENPENVDLVKNATEDLKRILESNDNQLLYELILSLLLCALKQNEPKDKKEE